MGNVKRGKKPCKCGNQEMVTDYDYIKEESAEFCDVCSTYRITKLKNNVDGGDYPPDWKPEYDIQTSKTGFVIKIFFSGQDGCSVSCVEKAEVNNAVETLRRDANVLRFAITFKDGKGNYQTQLFVK